MIADLIILAFWIGVIFLSLGLLGGLLSMAQMNHGASDD